MIKQQIQSTEMKKSFLFILLSLTLLLYSIQTFSPLRLRTDPISYFTLAISFSDNGNFLIHNQPSRFPDGYPFLISVLEKCGLANSGVLIGINIFFLLTGFFFLSNILKEHFEFSLQNNLIVCLLTSLSFSFVKYFTLPIPDFIYFGLSIFILYLLTKYRNSTFSEKLIVSIITILLLLISLEFRTIGFVLVFPMIWFWIPKGSGIYEVVRKIHIGWFIGFGFLLIGLIFFISQLTYFSEGLQIFKGNGAANYFFSLLDFRMTEFGELFINFPSTNIPHHLMIPVTGIGLVILCILLFSVIKSVRQIGIIEIYLIAYCLVILFWPYYDTRFWIPVFPFLVVYMFKYFSGYLDNSMWKRRLVSVYLSLYILLGFSGLIYTSNITFSGKRFPDNYNFDSLRPTYRYVFRNEKVDSSLIDWDAEKILRRYGK